MNAATLSSDPQHLAHAASMDPSGSMLKPSRKPRVTWVDTFRGLSITLVVIGHVIGGLAMASFVSERDQDWLWSLYKTLYTFRMPAMFLASGFFAARSIRKGIPRFLGAKTRTLLYPYLLWSLMGWGIHQLGSSLTNTTPDPWGPLKLLIDPLQGVWFLYVLFLVMVGYGAWMSRGDHRISFLVASGLLFLMNGFLGPGPILIDLVAQYAIFFGIGLVVADHLERIRGWMTLSRLLVVGPAMFGLMKLSVGVGWDQQPGLSLVPAMTGSAGMFSIALLVDRCRHLASCCRYLGQHSLQIYLASGYAAVATRIFLQKVLGLTELSLFLGLCSIAGLVGPLVLVACCKRFGIKFLFEWPTSDPRRPVVDRARMADSEKPGPSLLSMKAAT